MQAESGSRTSRAADASAETAELSPTTREELGGALPDSPGCVEFREVPSSLRLVLVVVVLLCSTPRPSGRW
jgi:hypothetical protein